MSDIVKVENALAVGSAMTVEAVIEQMAMVKKVQQGVMQQGTHYDTIPGTNKPTLLKPGAEKLLFTFRLKADPEGAEITEKDIAGLPPQHREVIVKLPIVSMATGQTVGFGVGSCSTAEEKYRYRNAKRVCPKCGAEAIIKGKAQYGGGYICFKKIDGCGEKFEDGDPAIEDQVVGKIENPDIADTYNTVLKMAKKRALVDGCLTSLGCSDLFTQDLEDMRHKFKEARKQGQEDYPSSTHAEEGESPATRQPGPENEGSEQPLAKIRGAYHATLRDLGIPKAEAEGFKQKVIGKSETKWDRGDYDRAFKWLQSGLSVDSWVEQNG